MSNRAIGRRQRFAGVAFIAAVMFAIAAALAPAFLTANLERFPLALATIPVILVIAPIVIARGGARLIQLLLAATVVAALSCGVLILLVTLDATTPAATTAFRLWWFWMVAVFIFALMSAPWSAWRRGEWA
jgi:hypothetical protein